MTNAAARESVQMTGDVAVSRFAGTAAEWDECVRRQAHWSHFHLYGWKSVIERVFGQECVYLEARDRTSHELVGVLPMVRVRSMVFGHFLVSMPFVNYGGPIGTDAAIRALVGEAGAVGGRDPGKLLGMGSSGAPENALPPSPPKITRPLHLPPTGGGV